ncbi:dTDP-4-dehydrorhamnose 3,5-epimerase [Desulfatiferula olefinivorans]
MKIVTTDLDGVLIIEPDVFGDHRGFFMESYSRKRYSDLGISVAFVQDNVSLSRRGILRGLHYQLDHPQAKLVQVLKGEVFDVAVDIRRGSPQFGCWAGVMLSEENRRQLYIPQGFAHGFVVTSETALFHYKCSDYYAPGDEYSLLWSDPDLGIAWPEEKPILSDKDRIAPVLKAIGIESLPVYSVK